MPVVIPDPPVPDSEYCTETDLYNESGMEVVREYARMTDADDPAQIDDRIHLAIRESKAFIDDWMLSAGKKVPLEVNDESNQETFDVALRRTAAKLAVVNLYNARSHNDVQQDDETEDSQPTTRSTMRTKQREAESQLSWWARPTDKLLKAADGVATGGGVGTQSTCL